MKKIEDFSRAISTAQSADEIRTALVAWEGKIEPALEVITTEGSSLDEALLMTLAISGTYIGALGRNPHLSPEMGEWLGTWMLRRAGSEAKKDRMHSAINCLVQLAQGGKLDWNGRTMQEVRGYFSDTRKSGGVRKKEAFADVIVRHPAAEPDLLAAALKGASDVLDVNACIALATHPQTHPETRRAAFALLRNPQPQHLSRIIECDLVLSDPEFREMLVEPIFRWGHWELIHPLLQAISDEEVAGIFRRLLAEGRTYVAIHMLRDLRSRLAPWLSRTDLLPLLESEDEKIRLAGVTCLAALPTPSDPEPPARTRSR